MTEARSKRAVLAALRANPDFSGLRNLPAADTRKGQRLLLWLDRSGLALSLCYQLQKRNAEEQVRPEWLRELRERCIRNGERTQDLATEARRIHSAFQSWGVTAATLKGFTLCPDFCDQPDFRHQVDFDYLVAATSVRRAADALRSCGYDSPEINECGETCLRTRLQHVPTMRDDLYEVQRQRQVDLHISIWEDRAWLPIEPPQDCLAHAVPQRVIGVEQLSLSLEDKFLTQILHVFRHGFRSWVRLSWILEIANCIERHRNDAALWDRVITRAGPAGLMRLSFAFVLGLTSELFETQVPEGLRVWSEEALTVPMRAWLNDFGVDWAMADWPGSLNNLLLAAEFIPERKLRRQYWRSRLLPKKYHASLGALDSAKPQQVLRWQVARFTYLRHRATVYLGGLMALAMQQYRWKRALRTCHKRILAETGKSLKHKGGVSYGNHASNGHGYDVPGQFAQSSESNRGD